VLPGGRRGPPGAGRRRGAGRARPGDGRAQRALRGCAAAGRGGMAGRDAALMPPIRVGTASWTDKTLLASGWYPPDVTSAEERLAFYAKHFPLVEVDSTYYTPPNERNSELWTQRTPEGFVFNIKAFSLLTQHPTRPAALYKDLRPEGVTKNVYLKDLDRSTVDAVWERFLAALQPLHESGR